MKPNFIEGPGRSRQKAEHQQPSWERVGPQSPKELQNQRYIFMPIFLYYIVRRIYLLQEQSF